MSQVKSAIDTILIETYGIDNATFGTNIYGSDLIRLIDEVTGVRNHTTTVQVKKDFFFDVPYIVNLSIPAYPIDGATIKIYVKTLSATTYTLMATSNSNGVITGSGSYNTNGSSINVATGVGTLIVNSGLSLPFSEYNVRVLCEADSTDLILNKRNYIFQYDSSNITVSYPF